MAPGLVRNEEDLFEKDKLEILYDGFFYDVTHFVDRHPGGNLIRFYTERGEDATQAIQQFHFRSATKVQAILKGLKRRPAEPHERGLEPKVLTRHEALSQDFKNLFEQLQSEGYFEPCIRHVILRLLECVAMSLIAYGFLFKYRDNPVKLFFSTIFVGFALSRWGWVQHEGGHRSLTGKKFIDQIIQDISICLMVGGSSVWWNSQHNRHHAMPQRIHRDVDLATLPFVAFHRKTVQNRQEINGFFIRYQFIFYWTIDLLLVTMTWKFYLHPRYQLKKKKFFEIFLGLMTIYLMYYFGPICYFLGAYWFAFFLGTNFALNHSHLEVTEKPTHWIEYSLIHTANITPSIFVDYWMGYLNYQIEHHLFPAMPQFRQREVSHRVKALAEKHGLPYTVFSYSEACNLAIKNLFHVGRDLSDENYFVKTESAKKCT